MTKRETDNRPAEFDSYATNYSAGMDNPVKAFLGKSEDDFIRVKSDWLGRQFANLRQDSGIRLLDYGCGAGALLRILAQQGWKPRLIGCDISERMLETARLQWPVGSTSYPDLHLQNGVRTPFENADFDIVVISAVLHHVPLDERNATMTEIGRVLRPGGRVVVFEHNPRNPVVRYVVSRTPIDRHAKLLDARETQKLLEDAAFGDVKISYLMFTPPRFRWMRPLDCALKWLPLGAQYVTLGRRS